MESSPFNEDQLQRDALTLRQTLELAATMTGSSSERDAMARRSRSRHTGDQTLHDV